MKAHFCCRETLFSLCLLMLAGCSRSGPEPFHERGNFSGRVRIEHQNAVSSGVIVCDVAFQREGRDRDQNLQVTFRQKGFAVTLAIGIVTSVFTAFVVTRWFTVMWLKAFRPKKLAV